VEVVGDEELEEDASGTILDSGFGCCVCNSSVFISVVTLGTAVFCGDGKTLTVTLTLSGDTPETLELAALEVSWP
jgi:hypothetical protein